MFFLVPSFSHAQAVTQDDLNAQLTTLRAELTDLLNQLVAQLQAQIDGQQAQINAIPTSTMTDTEHKAGSTGLSFSPTVTTEDGVTSLQADAYLFAMQFCLINADGTKDCSWHNVDRTDKQSESTFELGTFEPGEYHYEITGYQYGPSGKFNGVKDGGDWSSATVSGSFTI